jgi:hypothetical protein
VIHTADAGGRVLRDVDRGGLDGIGRTYAALDQISSF